MHRPLAGGDDIGVRGVQAEAPSGAVVEQHAGAGRRHAGAEPVGQAVYPAHRIAGAVGYAEVGGIPAPVHRRQGAHLGAGLEGVDLFPPQVGILGGEQAVQRPVHEVGVAGQAVAVGVGDFLGFHQQMDGVRRVGRHCRQIVSADDVEHFQEQKALGGRSGLIDGMSPVGGADGFPDIGVMVGEIGGGEQIHPRRLVQAGDHLAGQGAAVEGVGAAFGYGADGGGQVGVDQRFAFPGRASPLGQVDGGGGGEARQQFGVGGKDAGDAGRHGEAVLGVADGRRQQVGEGHRAEPLVQRLPCRRLARHRNRMRAGNRHQRQPLPAIVVGCCAGRRRAAAVDVEHRAGCGIVGQDERIAAQPAHWHDGDALHGGHGQGGVKGGAAILQNAQAGGGGQGGIGTHHALLSVHGAAGQGSDGHNMPPPVRAKVKLRIRYKASTGPMPTPARRRCQPDADAAQCRCQPDADAAQCRCQPDAARYRHGAKPGGARRQRPDNVLHPASWQGCPAAVPIGRFNCCHHSDAFSRHPGTFNPSSAASTHHSGAGWNLTCAAQRLPSQTT